MTLCYRHSETFNVDVAEKVIKVHFINILYEMSMVEVLFFIFIQCLLCQSVFQRFLFYVFLFFFSVKKDKG